jgi:uncharacterized protein (TIGR02391 family)
MKVMWDGTDLRISVGDEIEIVRGIQSSGMELRATLVRNITTGVDYRSRIEGATMSRGPTDLNPPIRGYVKSVQVTQNTNFEVDLKAPPLTGAALRQYRSIIDSLLFERCKDKDYHDVITNAFVVLEEKIRAKSGAQFDVYGQQLIDYAFNPKSGRLYVGETESERESYFLILRGIFGSFRNPSSHHLTGNESDVESFEIILTVDLLLKLVERARVRD